MATRPIYLDHHSTTPTDPRVVEAMLPWFTEQFGNAASRTHAYGWEAEAAVDAARAEVAALLGSDDPKTVVFTSGATEADNLAIKGVAELHGARGRHVVTTAIEHKAVIDSCRHLERAGFEVTFVRPTAAGIVEPDAIAGALRNDTILASVMLANNEVGTVQPVAEIASLTRARGVLLHVDAAQGVGRAPLDVDACGVDLVSISAHKIYGPKGIGALWVRRRAPRVRLVAQMDGGGHERGLRSGTPNVPGIVGLARACALLRAEAPAENLRLASLRDRLHQRITSGIDGVTLNGDARARHPGNLNLSFAGVDSASLLGALAPSVAVSSGAACSSATLEPSYVLAALGVPEVLARCSIRFGVGRSTTEHEIDAAAEAVVATVRKLRGT